MKKSLLMLIALLTFGACSAEAKLGTADDPAFDAGKDQVTELDGATQYVAEETQDLEGENAFGDYKKSIFKSLLSLKDSKYTWVTTTSFDTTALMNLAEEGGFTAVDIKADKVGSLEFPAPAGREGATPGGTFKPVPDLQGFTKLYTFTPTKSKAQCAAPNNDGTLGDMSDWLDMETYPSYYLVKEENGKLSLLRTNPIKVDGKDGFYRAPEKFEAETTDIYNKK